MIKKIVSKITEKLNRKVSKNSNNLNLLPKREMVENILKLKNIFNFENIDEKIFVDIPASSPSIFFSLPKVGVTNRKHRIKIKDPFNQNDLIELEADIEIFFDLPKNQRGLHMSRIEKAMQEFQNAGLTIKDYAFNLIKYAATLQDRPSGEIEVKFNYEKVTHKNSSGRLSHEILGIIFKAHLNESKNLTHKIGLSVPFMNACPCPQRWSIREFHHYLRKLGFNDEEIYKISAAVNFGTHTNLGQADVIIEDLNDNINYNDLYMLLDKSVLITRELLSGRDEFEFIKEALLKEQFCEDVAREIIRNIVNDFKNNLNPESLLEIVVEVNESIHFHNLKVEIKDKFKNILENILDTDEAKEDF